VPHCHDGGELRVEDFVKFKIKVNKTNHTNIALCPTRKKCFVYLHREKNQQKRTALWLSRQKNEKLIYDICERGLPRLVCQCGQDLYDIRILFLKLSHSAKLLDFLTISILESFVRLI